MCVGGDIFTPSRNGQSEVGCGLSFMVTGVRGILRGPTTSATRFTVARALMPSDFMAIDGTVSNLTASNPKAAEDQELSSSKASKEQNGVLPAQV